jgi:hypothetical protein
MLERCENEVAKLSLPSKSFEKANPVLTGDACGCQSGDALGGGQDDCDLPSRMVMIQTSFHQPCCKLKKINILNLI